MNDLTRSSNMSSLTEHTSSTRGLAGLGSYLRGLVGMAGTPSSTLGAAHQPLLRAGDEGRRQEAERGRLEERMRMLRGEANAPQTSVREEQRAQKTRPRTERGAGALPSDGGGRALSTEEYDRRLKDADARL